MTSTPRITDRDRARRIRRSRRALRLGSPTPVCVMCGCAAVEALVGVEWEELPEGARRRVIERHHPAGRAADSFTIPLCRTCHALATERQRDLPSLLRPRTDTERRAARLHGVAETLWVIEMAVTWMRAVIEEVVSSGPERLAAALRSVADALRVIETVVMRIRAVIENAASFMLAGDGGGGR